MNDDTLVRILVFGAMGLILFVTLVQTVLQSFAEQRAASRVSAAEDEANAPNPDGKVKPAWDLARATLEAYFQRNLRQVAWIFWLSVVVMTVGMGIVVWGLSLAVAAQDKAQLAIVSSAAGVLTQAIGATFLVIYRSTMQQAAAFTATLERINAVGMAMQVLDTMPGGSEKNSLKTQTRAEIARLLVSRSYAPGSPPEEAPPSAEDAAPVSSAA
jgi:hypothetical protein